MFRIFVVAVFICIISALFLASCASDAPGSEDADSERQDNVIVVGYAQVGAESAWRLANTQSFIDTFSDTSKYDFHIVDCRNTPSVQQAAVYDFIAQEFDYIIIAPIEEYGWQDILEEARDAGIPVIISDRMIDVSDESLYVFWVGGNFLQEGLDAVAWLESYIAEIGREDDTLNIFHMQGQLGSTAQIGRTSGITEALRQNPNFVLLEQESADFTMAMGEEVMIDWLGRYPISEIDVLIAENDDMAFGAIRAMQASGIIPGREVIVISFDAGRKAVQAVADGLINCTIESNPLQGPSVRENIELLESGIVPEKRQYAHTGRFFDITNAAGEVDGRY